MHLLKVGKYMKGKFHWEGQDGVGPWVYMFERKAYGLKKRTCLYQDENPHVQEYSWVESMITQCLTTSQYKTPFC